MFKSIIALTAIFAIVTAQNAGFTYHPLTQQCFEEIKASVEHAQTLVKSFSSLSLGTISEAAQLLGEAKATKETCSEVPYSHIAKYAAETKSVFTDMCIENVLALKQKVKLTKELLKTTKSLPKMFSAVKSIASAAKDAVSECKKKR